MNSNEMPPVRPPAVADPQPLEIQINDQVRMLWRMVIALVVAVVAVAALATYGFLQSSDAQTHSAGFSRALAHQALTETRALNIQREREIHQLCVDQNHRHTASLGYIRKLAHRQIRHTKPKHRAAVRRKIRRQLREYAALFQALAPKEPCKHLPGPSPDH